MSQFPPGWADKLGQQLSGESDEWYRMRARNGRPFRHCGNDAVAKAQQGSVKGARSKKASPSSMKALEVPEEEK